MAIQKPILNGEKVLLRPITADDAESMYSALFDEESMRLTGTQGTFTLEQVQAHCTRIANADDRYDYAITLPEDPDATYIGEVVLNQLDEDNNSANFRIALANSTHFGKGYGSEATKLLIDFGFEQLNLHRIELEVYDFNPRAQRVYEKVGFVVEGIRRDVLLWDGKYQSGILMAMLRSDWENRKG